MAVPDLTHELNSLEERKHALGAETHRMTSMIATFQH